MRALGRRRLDVSLPELAVAERTLGDTDGDPLTVADPTWTPLITNPPYPDHPSGYNCQSGAFMHAAKAFFDRRSSSA